MTRFYMIVALAMCGLTIGCGGKDEEAKPNVVQMEPSEQPSLGGAGGGGGNRGGGGGSVSVAVESGKATISAENTSLGFVGSKPNGESHTGGFGEFSGTIEMDGETLKKIAVEIQTASLFTDAAGLTTHLKNTDFFSVNQYPTAKFESTSIEGSGDAYTVKGNLTLLAETKEISFPVTAGVTDGQLKLNGEFKINRMDFGMNYGPDKINADVDLKIEVGKAGGPEQSAGRGRGRGGRGFNPGEMFGQWDKDGDGKLSGDEIPERMRDRVESIDTDGDKAVSKEELEKAFQGRGGRGGGGRGGRGGGGGQAGGVEPPPQ